MSSNNRTAILTKVHKVLKKHYKPVTPTERPLLEQMLYACVLENARHEAADEAYAKLQENLFDWNEVRVTTVSELAEIISCLPDATLAAQRLKKSLQSVFEAHYSFDLEAMKKQNLGKSEKDLEKIQGISPFVMAYIVQNALEGHSIPVNRGAIDILYAVSAINDAEADKWQVPGMERAIPKNKGTEFGSLLHQMGADFFASPGSSKLKAILAEIDPDFKDRLAARTARLEKEAAEAAVKRREAAVIARAAAIEAAKKPPSPPPKGKGKSHEKSAPKDKTPQKLPPVTHVPSAKELAAKEAAKEASKSAHGKDVAKPAAKETPKAPPAKEQPKPPAKPAAKEPVKHDAKKDHGKDHKDHKKPADKPKHDSAKDVKKSSKTLAKKKPR